METFSVDANDAGKGERENDTKREIKIAPVALRRIRYNVPGYEADF